jgi:hypothetical protein
MLNLRWLLSWFRTVFGGRQKPTDRSHLMSMYFNESNRGGRKKSNRDRA